MAEKHDVPVRKEAAPPGEIVRSPMLGLRHEIDRLFDEFLSWSPFRSSRFEEPLAQLGIGRGALRPRADMIEQEDNYEIDIDVPGVKRDDIEISLSDNTLTVRCQVAEQKEEKGGEYYVCERQHGSFSRSFTLPHGVEADKAEADLHDGLLTITLPKSEEAKKKARRIEVRSH